jgi:hypothetical protein
MPASVASVRLSHELFGLPMPAGDSPSTDVTVAVEVLVEALLDPREQTWWHLVIATFRGDDGSKFGVEVEGLEAILATAEVGMDRSMTVLRERPVEKGLEFSDGLVAVIHLSVLSRGRCHQQR